ncbi:MAG: NYN domain-containing protein [Candidatus Hydrogenedentota bacterium]
MEIIIDGYNLIFKSKELKSIYKKHPEKCIEHLCELLSHFGKDVKFSIIFDESTRRPYKELKSYVTVNGIKIYYNENADEFILEKARNSKERCLVVSSDIKDVYKPAKKLKCDRISSEGFLEILNKKREKIIKRTEPKSHPLPKPEIRFWLRFFSRPPQKLANIKLG